MKDGDKQSTKRELPDNRRYENGIRDALHFIGIPSGRHNDVVARIVAWKKGKTAA